MAYTITRILKQTRAGGRLGYEVIANAVPLAQAIAILAGELKEASNGEPILIKIEKTQAKRGDER